MAEKITGLSRELIIHPGETLNDVLEDRNISQVELAHRTGVTGAHISKIINGAKGISVSFAKKLEYALGVDSSFWVNLQAIYDCEMAEYEEANNINSSEIQVLSQLKDVIKYIQDLELIEPTHNKTCQVMELRKLFCISNLNDIPKLAFSGAFRISQSNSIDVYVLYAWIRLCQIRTSMLSIDKEINIQLLKDSIPNIKSLMFIKPEDMQDELQRIFANCGIAFSIEKNFTGAPVQGYIRTNNDNTISLSLTIRGAFADRFWFTLFHEIGHIVNGDIGAKNFIDYTISSNEVEQKANEYAKNILLNSDAYNKFISEEDFSIYAIEEFAKTQGVLKDIVIGRLQNDEILDYSQYSKQKIRYKWAD